MTQKDWTSGGRRSLFYKVINIMLEGVCGLTSVISTVKRMSIFETTKGSLILVGVDGHNFTF